MIAEPYRTSMTVEEYLELDRTSQDTRYEYIDSIVTLLAGGTANHSRVSINLTKLLDSALQDQPCQIFNSDMRVSISATRYVYPDVSVSCDPRDQQQGDIDIIHHPCLIVEVLSPTTEAYDRTKKFSYYRDCPSVQEVILVSTQEQAVDLYRRATDKLWTLHLFRLGDEIELTSVNVRMPIAAIYEKIVFSQGSS